MSGTRSATDVLIDRLYAGASGLKPSTVRTHIASPLAKTQADRQLLMLARLEGRA